MTRTLKKLAAIILTTQTVALPFAGAQEEKGASMDRVMISGDFWKPDKVIWGDGRPLADEPGPEHIPHGFKSDWQITVPETGWYELYLVGSGGDFAHDVFLDGKTLYLHGSTDRAEKARNLWLAKGEHALRIQRVGRSSFPMRAFKQFELRRADGSSGNAITANKTLVDVMRAGEEMVIEVTGGGTGQPANYELLSYDRQQPDAGPEVVGTVSFPAGKKPETKTVRVACPREGAFTLSARVAGGRELSSTEFPIGPYAVIDVTAGPSAGSKPELVHELDCVEQTLNGKPIGDGIFVECNGPSRVVETAIGRYRESHDCTPPEAAPPGSGGAGQAESYSGFSYRLSLPQIQVPYLLEVEFPDDDQRCIVVGPHWLNPETGELSPLSGGYNTKSIQTGGLFPLSNRMQTHRAVFWPKTSESVLTIFSQEIGTRAAVARIRLYRFADGNLPLPPVTENGRNFLHWYEEAHNWVHLVGVDGTIRDPLVRNLEGLKRWAQFVRYHGLTCMSALGVGYQSAFWRQTHLEGFQAEDVDLPRLAALICEKYGLKYMPEIFPTQWYASLVTLPGRAEHPDDIRTFNANGKPSGKGAAACNLNPLHPEVQKMWVNGLGELSDKLRDCKSFLGVSIRANVWQFRGDFTLPSLGWGYGDWIIREFEKDTGVKVPGDPDDPERFMTRYEFLTSPEQKERWVNWRCDRLLDYHIRLRDRIRGDRDDVKLVFWGSFRSDPIYQVPGDTLTRMRECGVDLAKVQQAGNIAIMPAARYGSRFTTSATQGIYDGFFDVDAVRTGMGEPRAFGAYMNYLELAREWPAEKLGLKLPAKETKPPYHCSASLGAGRNSLEKFAVVLAEQDTALFHDGGNADCLGDAELWKEWFAEYRALPPVAFQRVDSARDPVAVWQQGAGVRGQESGSSPATPSPDLSGHGVTGLLRAFFYAVNRERWPVTIELAFDNCREVTRLTSGEATQLQDGKLTLELQPFELRSFSMPAGARIVSSKTTIPQAMHDYVHNRITFAQQLRESLTPDSLPAALLADYDEALATAWDALERKAYWRARTILRSAPMMRVYEQTGRMPDGQVVGKFPNLLREVENAGHWQLIEPLLKGDELIALAGADAQVVASTTLNPEWGGYQVLASTDGKLKLELDVPAEGLYALHLGLVAKETGPIMVQAGGKALMPAIVKQAGVPDTATFQNVQLAAGKQTVELNRPDGVDFGLYGLKMLPKMQPLGSEKWAVAGPFRGFWGHMDDEGNHRHSAADVKAGLEKAYPPETNPDLNALYQDEDGSERRWLYKAGDLAGAFSDVGVDMSVRTGSSGKDFNFALTHIHADRDRTALLMVPCDWWARAYLNGERLRSNVPQTELEASGADFTTHYPRFHAVMQLKKGKNTLLLKVQGGSLGSGFGAYISDAAGIEVGVGK
jgi:hypothetical protein